jgi:2-phospho-L-lactate guanylyltransferase (CobY/MobA/RfbA family)
VDLLVVGPGGALAQRGSSFAERLANAFAEARALGYESILAVPTDVPRLGRRELAEAFRRLEETAVVLGPSPDGGAYLIGCRTDPTALFAGVRWQTSRTFADLAANAVAPALLDPLEDVDRWADILALGSRPGSDRALAALISLVAGLLRRSLPGPWAEPSHRTSRAFLLPLANRPPPRLFLPAL